MLTKHSDVVHAQTVSRIAHYIYRAHAQMEAVAKATPLIASNGDVLALLKCCYRITDRYDKEQTLPLTSFEAWWLVPAPA